MVDFPVGHRRKAPRSAKRLVVQVQKRMHLLCETFLVDAASCKIEAAIGLFDNKPQFLIKLLQHFHMAPKRVHVLNLAKSVAFDQPTIVGWIVSHHEKWWSVKALDQQTTLIIQR